MKTGFKALLIIISYNLFQTHAFGEMFDPKYEGTYEITVKCQAEDQTPECNQLQGAAHRLRIYNVLHNEGVYIVIWKNNQPSAYFLSQSTKRNGAELIATSNTVDRPTLQLGLSFHAGRNRKQAVEGWIRDTHFQYDLALSGNQLVTPYEFFNANVASPLSISTLLRNYEGKRGDNNSTLAIRSNALKDDAVIASFSDQTTKTSIEFTYSRLYPEFGVLVLASPQGYDPKLPNHWTKFIFAVTENPTGEVQLEGVALYTDTSSYSPLTFKGK